MTSTAESPSASAPDGAPDGDVRAARAAVPDARPPDRCRRVDSGGVGIAVCEWGDADAPPLLLAHGGFDFARTFDVFAPLLAGGGWRVVSWDQRGHGDSDHAELYSWDADVRDTLAVLDGVGRDPLPAVGHSKGGGVLLSLLQARPERFTRFANLDGLPWKEPHPDIADHERPRYLADGLEDWLDHRRRTATARRRPGSLDDLARRRGRMNPRLGLPWLRYLVTVGARRDPDGWRWKLDPILRLGGFGPWRPEWTLRLLPELPHPFLALLAGVAEPMGTGATPEDLVPFLPPGGRLVPFEHTGHFLHIERPREVADLVLGFLA